MGRKSFLVSTKGAMIQVTLQEKEFRVEISGFCAFGDFWSLIHGLIPQDGVGPLGMLQGSEVTSRQADT